MMINKFLFTALTIVLFLISCSTDSNLTGGSETGNPIVSGFIYKTDQTASIGSIVTLTTDDYNFINQKGRIFIDTTDQEGYYQFKDVPFGNYNLKAINTLNYTVSFSKDLSIEDNESIDTFQFIDTLEEFSYIELTLPENIDTTNKYLFIWGTDYYFSLSNAYKIESGEWALILEGLPDEIFLDLYIVDISNSTDPILIDNFYIEEPGDTLDLGIFDISKSYDKFNSKLTTNTITKLLYDQNNNIIWIGTYLGGLLKWNLTVDTMTLYTKEESGLKDNYITALALDSSGRLYVGTHQSGLNILEDGSWHYYTNDDIPGMGNSISSLEISPDNKCLIGTPQIFAKLDMDSSIIDTYEDLVIEDNITSIVAISETEYWLGTNYSGLINLHDDTADFYLSDTYDIPDNMITAMYKSLTGTIWIGTIYGVSSIDKSKNISSHYIDYSGNLDIYSISEDSRNNIWYGLQGDPSLLRFDGTKYKEYYMDYIDLTENPGNINSIIAINNKYYVATENAGILILDENLRKVRSINKPK